MQNDKLRSEGAGRGPCNARAIGRQTVLTIVHGVAVASLPCMPACHPDRTLESPFRSSVRTAIQVVTAAAKIADDACVDAEAEREACEEATMDVRRSLTGATKALDAGDEANAWCSIRDALDALAEFRGLLAADAPVPPNIDEALKLARLGAILCP
jgi:hypothetical protein